MLKINILNKYINKGGDVTDMSKVVDLFIKKEKFIIASVLLFILGVLAGYLIFLKNPDFIVSNFEELFGDILKLGRKMKTRSKLYVVGLIFQNNLRALLLIMFGGVVLGIITIFGITFNGFIVGIVLALNFYNGQSLVSFLAAILPHGIFELPVILLGGAFGLKMGFELIFPGNVSRNEKFKKNLYQCICSLIVLVPTLFIAAAVEAIVTPYIMRSLS